MIIVLVTVVGLSFQLTQLHDSFSVLEEGLGGWKEMDVVL